MFRAMASSRLLRSCSPARTLEIGISAYVRVMRRPTWRRGIHLRPNSLAGSCSSPKLDACLRVTWLQYRTRGPKVKFWLETMQQPAAGNPSIKLMMRRLHASCRVYSEGFSLIFKDASRLALPVPPREHVRTTQHVRNHQCKICSL